MSCGEISRKWNYQELELSFSLLFQTCLEQWRVGWRDLYASTLSEQTRSDEVEIRNGWLVFNCFHGQVQTVRKLLSIFVFSQLGSIHSIF